MGAAEVPVDGNISAQVDVAVIGAGAVGLAIAWELSRYKKQNVVVIEANKSFGQETSSRNSEVIHAGIYNSAGMLKTRLCLEGNKLLYEFCQKYKVAHKKLGKIILACNEVETDQLYKLYMNAVNNGVKIELISTDQIKQLEPSLNAGEAIYSPETGIIDSHELMQRFYYLGKNQDVNYLFNAKIINIEYTGHRYLLETASEKIEAVKVINSAGLYSDQVAGYLLKDIKRYGYRLFPCKGEYYRLKGKYGIRHLVYPLPSEGVLGIHITPDMQGNLRLGPNAYYVSDYYYHFDESHKEEFYLSTLRFLPALTRDQITPDYAGIRPRLQGPGDTGKDFVISEESDKGFPGFINLIGIESPGLTSSLAIARYVNSLLD